MPLRRSFVYDLEVVTYTRRRRRLDLRVSSGTYVRAIAQALGGHCTSLRRLTVGPFSVEEAADVERSSCCRRRRRSSGSRTTISSACPRRFGPVCCTRAADRRGCRVTVARRPRSSNAAAVGRDRHVRRSPPGHQAVIRAAVAAGAPSDRRHLRPASADGAREPGRAARDARAPAGAAYRRGCRRRARRRLHAGDRRARPRRRSRAIPAGARGRDRGRGRGLSVRPRARAISRSCARSGSRRARCRSSRASRRR